jgi:hypothetical protein
MQAVPFPARQPRSHYRHELRTLTYVTLDEANGGIIRNVNHQGVAVQAVAPLRPQQRVRLRFDLRFPRVRVEANGEVSWASRSGQCGIRFVDLPERTSGQIDQWIFSNLLEVVAREAAQPHSIFGAAAGSSVQDEITSAGNDGLTLSPAARPVIVLEPDLGLNEAAAPYQSHAEVLSDVPDEPALQLDWLYRPISARTLAGLVDGLVVLAAVLLFALIFLSIAHELPQWPLTLSGALAAAVLVAASYWALFAVFGGASLGARLARAATGMEEKEERDRVGRFR